MAYPYLLLRELVDVNYATKGSVLSWEELDINLKNLGDAINILSEVDTSSFDVYDPMFEYQVGADYYVAYGGNIWKFIGLIPNTGTAPGTDDSVWEISSSGAFAHEKNKDTILAEGTSDEVTANEIRTFIDSFPDYITEQYWKSPDNTIWKITIDNNGEFQKETV